MNISMFGFKCDYSTYHKGTTELDVSLSLLQIDNQLPGAQFPVVLGAAPVNNVFAHVGDGAASMAVRHRHGTWVDSGVHVLVCRAAVCSRASCVFCVHGRGCADGKRIVDNDFLLPHPEVDDDALPSRDTIAFRLHQQHHDSVAYVTLCSCLLQKLAVSVRVHDA
jgi:hypothetical protein